MIDSLTGDHDYDRDVPALKRVSEFATATRIRSVIHGVAFQLEANLKRDLKAYANELAIGFDLATRKSAT